ncbi:MAG: undecaprenyl/decaprenyl-phosphate alpha-N-acetylglucosaminyl 1-phosphate transferase [Deltaproteobacteria bacterium]|nr:undecaprenyl/decaprenyl-phosphate alpha-N-acetylglucosaminyl 1-phosphate transferase [Deltaproteobacteria bacterium]
MTRAGAAFVLAAILSCSITPLIRWIAITCGFLDRPDGKLKRHPAPVPYLGGVAVFISFVLSLVVFGEARNLGWLLLAGSFVLVVGLIDDLLHLDPWSKLGGQAVAVGAMLYALGTYELELLPLSLKLGVSFVWLLSVTNAFNLVDNMDGLAAGVGMVGAVILAGVALSSGAATATLALAALGGSLLGFLRYNFSPATIFMGDAGSNFIGLMLGALSLHRGVTHEPLGLLVPALVLGLPLADMSFVILVRSGRGASIMHGSPDHVALRLRQRGFTTRQTVCASYLGAAVFGALGVSVGLVNSITAAVIVAAILLILCVALPWIATRDRLPM